MLLRIVYETAVFYNISDVMNR